MKSYKFFRKVGNIEQLAGIRRVTLNEGLASGLKVIELYNSSGIRASLVEDQCLNIYDFSYKGINFAFLSKNGLVAKNVNTGVENDFVYYWPAGMMYTCGLGSTGPASEENGICYPEHGRIGTLPATEVCAKKDFVDEDFIMQVSGKVQDGALCGDNLLLERKISLPLESKELYIEDKVINMESAPADFMILYHFNFGYPLVDEGAKFIKGKGTVKNRIEGESVPDDYYEISGPMDHKEEEVYFHDIVPDKDGYAYAGIVNHNLELGCYVKYKVDTLPILVQWKNMCSHDYCIGIEPSNSFIMGRAEERANGTLQTLDGYSSIEFSVILGVLDGKQEISEFYFRLGIDQG